LNAEKEIVRRMIYGRMFLAETQRTQKRKN